MASANLTPGGFYKHFQSKDQLIAEASREAFHRAYAMLRSETVGKSPAQAIERIVWLYLEQPRDKKGPHQCPLAMRGAELSHSHPQVRAIAMHGYERLIQLIASHLAHQTRRKALIIANGIVSTLVGAITLAEIAPKAEMASATLINAKILIEKYISQT